MTVLFLSLIFFFRYTLCIFLGIFKCALTLLGGINIQSIFCSTTTQALGNIRKLIILATCVSFYTLML